MMEKFQKFGSAMIIPAMLFAVTGIIIGFGTLFTTELVMGSIAEEGTIWSGFWNMMLQGAWTIFNQLPLLFVVSLPIKLASKQNARACMEALVIFLIFNNYVSAILGTWGSLFGVDFSQEVGSGSGLAMIANIKTLDMGMVGSILIALIVIYIHNNFIDFRLPEWLGVFNGSALIVGIGFIVMIPVAFLACLIWPSIQGFINNLQDFIVSSGRVGVWLFVFLERMLIPTGLHHIFIAPINLDSALVPGGISPMWAKMLPEFAQSTKRLIELAPWSAFSSAGWTKMLGSTGAALAMYKTARPENKKKVAGILLPVTLTALIAGITEPIEFTFLFVAPPLFLVHAILGATTSVIMVSLGVVGDFGSGLLESLTKNIIPLAPNHWREYLPILIVAPIVIFVWYFIFKKMIIKFDFKTPGREDPKEKVKMYYKKDYKEKIGNEKNASQKELNKDDEFKILADNILIGLGGADNIKDFTNCVTRLRVNVKDPSLVESDEYFKEIGSYGTSRNKTSIHVIVGLNIQYVADEFGQILEND